MSSSRMRPGSHSTSRGVCDCMREEGRAEKGGKGSHISSKLSMHRETTNAWRESLASEDVHDLHTPEHS